MYFVPEQEQVQMQEQEQEQEQWQDQTRTYCGKCEQYGDWSKKWQTFYSGSKYYVDKDGPKIFYVCPACIRDMSRSTERDMRYSHYRDLQSWLSECDGIWRAEVARVAHKVKQSNDAWQREQRRYEAQLRQPDVIASCDIVVPSKRRKMMLPFEQQHPLPFGGDNNIPIPPPYPTF
jgi:hypothetical protein